MANEPQPRQLSIPETELFDAPITDTLLTDDLKTVAVILACGKTESLEVLAEVLQIDPEKIRGHDPEFPLKGKDEADRVEEPFSDTPVVPLIFKLEMIKKALRDLYGEEIAQQQINRTIANLTTVMGTNGLNLAYLDALMKEVSEAQAERYANEHVIFGSDIVLKIDGQAVHQYRTKETEDLFTLEESELGSLIFSELNRRHAQEVHLEWDCAFGIAYEGKTRITEFVIEADLPALPETIRRDLILEFFNPGVSGGLKWVELIGTHFPDQPFTLRTLNVTDGGSLAQVMPISRQEAEWLIVKKVLPRHLYGQLLSNEPLNQSIYGESIGVPDKAIDYDMVPLALAQVRILAS